MYTATWPCGAQYVRTRTLTWILNSMGRRVEEEKIGEMWVILLDLVNSLHNTKASHRRKEQQFVTYRDRAHAEKTVQGAPETPAHCLSLCDLQYQKIQQHQDSIHQHRRTSLCQWRLCGRLLMKTSKMLCAVSCLAATFSSVLKIKAAWMQACSFREGVHWGSFFFSEEFQTRWDSTR